ncbi:MAG: hypothetical protein IJY05_00395 [Clostridia bacterium]|nr:hypothetical protein [Clostridia bacterium]
MDEKMFPVEELVTPEEETVAEAPAAEKTTVVEDVQKVEVSCCKCGVALKVKIGTEVCMCPKCGEIFKVKATVRRVKDVSSTQITKAYVKVDKDAEGNVKTTTVLQ